MKINSLRSSFSASQDTLKSQVIKAAETVRTLATSVENSQISIQEVVPSVIYKPSNDRPDVSYENKLRWTVLYKGGSE